MSDGNLTVLERLYAALKTRDAQVIEQVFAPDVEFDIAEVHGFELRNGRIVRFTASIDTPAMLDALRKQ